MTGAIETIQWDRDFKILCDGLLRFELGKLVQTFGSDGSDGGVDAEYNGVIDGTAGRWVFQYKFRSPKEALSKRRSWLVQRYAGPNGRPTEFDKDGVRKADGYVLLTNVPVTPAIVQKLSAGWHSRKHKGPLCVWDSSRLNALMKGREHLARSWSGAKEARCLQKIILPAWQWLQGAEAVALDWTHDPLWPLEIQTYQVPSPVGAFHQNFTWNYRLRIAPRAEALRQVHADPQFHYAATVAYPRALRPFEDVCKAVDGLSKVVRRHVDLLRDDLVIRLPQLEQIGDAETRAEIIEALAYCILENQWGFPMRGLHSIRGGRLVIGGRYQAWEEPALPEIEPVLDEMVRAVPHGVVDSSVAKARALVVKRVQEWWRLLWQVVSFGIDAEPESLR